MTADDAFRRFVTGALLPDKAERLARLIATPRGKRRVLETLSHDFSAAISKESATPDKQVFWSQECFVFRPPQTFGDKRESFAVAYDELSATDAWLIVSTDGKFGMHRPEGKWDDGRTIAT